MIELDMLDPSTAITTPVQEISTVSKDSLVSDDAIQSTPSESQTKTTPNVPVSAETVVNQ